MKEFVEEFAKSMNRPSFLPTPAFIWKLIFGPERATIVTEGQKVVPRRTIELGYKFRFPTIDMACFEFAHVFYKDADEKWSSILARLRSKIQFSLINVSWRFVPTSLQISSTKSAQIKNFVADMTLTSRYFEGFNHGAL